MDANFMPVIKLTVEGMTANIMNAMGVMGSDLETHINAAVEKAVADLDYNRIVRDTIEVKVAEEIRSYFTYGRGGKDITLAVTEAMNKLKKANDSK